MFSYRRLWLCIALFAVLAIAIYYCPAVSDSDSYGQLPALCGNNPIPVDPETVPELGCFIIKVGHVTKGVIGKHHITLAVNEKGEESYTSDGKPVEDVSVPQTAVELYDRKENQSELFIVWQCVPPDFKFCASTKQEFERATVTAHDKDAP